MQVIGIMMETQSMFAYDITGTYSENSRGPKTLHCGTPEENSELHEVYSFIEIF